MTLRSGPITSSSAVGISYFRTVLGPADVPPVMREQQTVGAGGFMCLVRCCTLYIMFVASCDAKFYSIHCRMLAVWRGVLERGNERGKVGSLGQFNHGT